MSVFESVILGMIQGFTEFLPVSSSGHLVLFELLFGAKFSESTLRAFDIVVHAGSLIALVLFFWKDWWGIVTNFYKKWHAAQKLFFLLVLASIPAVVFGLFAGDMLDEHSRSFLFIGCSFLVSAVFFQISEYFYKKKQGQKNTYQDPSWKQSLVIGISQAVAIIPGISRSGSTLATGLMLGFDRQAALRFSFLMGAPIIFGALLLLWKDIFKGEILIPDVSVMIFGFFSSFVMSLLSIQFLLEFFKKYTLFPFSVYLFVLGGGSILWYFFML